jgi:hypothetical protein
VQIITSRSFQFAIVHMKLVADGFLSAVFHAVFSAIISSSAALALSHDSN